MATFFFRAVASDGKGRHGSLSADDEKVVARELRKQGLIPVYVGAAPKGASVEFKLPVFGARKLRRVAPGKREHHRAQCHRRPDVADKVAPRLPYGWTGKGSNTFEHNPIEWRLAT